MSRRPPDTRPDESDIAALRARNRDLEEKLAILNDGTQVDREKYEALERKLRKEQDDQMQIIRAYRDMENRLEESVKKCEKYEALAKKYKEQSRFGNRVDQNREQQIIDLKKDKSEMESLNVKHRQDILSYIAENKKLSDANQRLEAHIQDVDIALAQMLERNKELARSLQESELRNERLVNELDQEKKNVYRLEYDIAKLRDDERRDQRFLQESRLDAVETNFANAQQKLLIATNTIEELKSRIAKLEKEEQRAAKLQIELAKQKQINENLEDQNYQLETELESNRGSDEEYRKKIEDLTDRIQQLDESYEERIDAMKVEVEYYRKRTEKEFKVNAELEEQMLNKDKEIEDLKEEIAKYLDQTYGLPQAVNEIRQLKAMVSVRDAQIADMINENQMVEKVIYELIRRLPPDVNINDLFKNFQKHETEAQQKQAEQNVMALLKKTLKENKQNNAGEIKIILGSGTPHKRTLVQGKEDDSFRDYGFAQKIASGLRRSRRASSMNSSEVNEDTDRGDLDTDSLMNYSESETDFAASQVNIMMKRKQKKDKERKKQDKQKDQPSPQVGYSNKMVTSDVACQAYLDDFHATDKTDAEEKEEDKDDDSSRSQKEDKWVRELRGKLKKVKSEKATLEEQLKAAREEFNKKVKESEEKTLEIKSLNVRIEDLLVQIDKLKSDLKQNHSKHKSPRSSRRNSDIELSDDTDDDDPDSSSDGTISARRRKQKYKSLNREDDPLRIDHEDASVQWYSGGVEVKISKRSQYFEIRPTKLRLSYQYNEDDVFQLPTPEELDVIDARIKILQSEVFEAEHNAVQSEQKVEELQHKIDQKDQMISELQKTILNLEKRLDEQRDNFNEKLQKMNDEHDRTIEARLKQLNDLNDVNSRRLTGPFSEANLSDVSMRLEQLNRDKAKLIDELTETKEAMKFMQRQNDQLKETLKKLQGKYDEISEKQMDSSRQKLMDYSSGLKIKYTALQKKYTELQRNYEDLKKFKESRNEPLDLTSRSRSSEKSVDSDNGGSASARDAAKLQSANLKIEQLKTQNEEMQLKLGKSQITIERLNQLLQRKEKQLTKIQEQATQYKHMLAKQQMSKKS